MQSDLIGRRLLADTCLSRRSYFNLRLVHTCSDPCLICLSSKTSELFFRLSAFGKFKRICKAATNHMFQLSYAIRAFSQHAMLQLLASLKQASTIWSRWVDMRVNSYSYLRMCKSTDLGCEQHVWTCMHLSHVQVHASKYGLPGSQAMRPMQDRLIT